MSIPLISPEPVRSAAHFVGREREVVQISELLALGRSCALVGPAGSGKTSLLWHLEQTADLLLDQIPISIYLDLLGVRTNADFYAPMLRALAEPGDDELALAQALINAPNTMLLLLIDHLERAGGGFNSVVRSALRGWIRDGRIIVLAASDLPLDRAAPDLQTTLLQLTVAPLSEREARALTTSFLERINLEAAAGEISGIIGVAGGYPERVRRAVELWARSDRGVSFDWVRSFREEYPQQAVLDTSITGFAPELEAEPQDPATVVAPARATRHQQRQDQAHKPDHDRLYRADDAKSFLVLVVVLALAGLVGLGLGGWLGLLAFAAVLVLFTGLAWLLIRLDGPRWSNHPLVVGVRSLPLLGRLLPR